MINSSFTTNIQLVRACKRFLIPLIDICFKDELMDSFARRTGCEATTQNPLPGAYIINMADSRTSNGSHWVALWIQNGKVVYFDSFGIAPPQEVRKFAERFGVTNILINPGQIQSISSGHCGQYCLSFLHAMCYGNGTVIKKYKRFLDQFQPVRFF